MPSKWTNALVASAALGVFCVEAHAVESTFGLYSLGSGAVAAGVTPPEGGYVTIGASYNRWRLSKPIPFAGTSITGDIYMPVALGSFMWVTPPVFLGGQLSFAMTTGVADMKIIAGVGGKEQSARGTGATDTSLRMSLGWKIHESFSHKISITEVVPTGRYSQGFNPNIGLNRTGTDFSWGATYLETGTKIELSGTAGFTIEGYNPITNYRSGNAIHFEQGLSKYFDNGLRVGVVSYQYLQISDDAGSAILGPFRTRMFGIGPSFGYNTMINNHIVSFTLQGTREVASRNRLHQTSGSLVTTVKF